MHEHADVAEIGVGAHLGADGVTVELGHHHIEYHQVRALGAHLLQRGDAVAGGLGLEAFTMHEEFKRDDDAGLVVDDEDAGHMLLSA